MGISSLYFQVIILKGSESEIKPSKIVRVLNFLAIPIIRRNIFKHSYMPELNLLWFHVEFIPNQNTKTVTQVGKWFSFLTKFASTEKKITFT